VTLQEWMPALRVKLSAVPTDDTVRDIRLLAAHAMGVEPSRMTLHMHDELSEDVQSHLSEMIEKRALCMPISKIIERRMFWGRSFAVNSDVLDPRGDTETLIAAALALGPKARLLDLGTGSGAIALTLAAEWRSVNVVATDVSDSALRVAQQNVEALGLGERVSLMQSDWFESVVGRFDLIVSNPPYIALDEWRGLDKDVRNFDPRIALTDEGDGLGAYREIIAAAGGYLHIGGCLMVEIGWTQGADVSTLFDDAGFREIKCLPDMVERDRVIMGVWTG
jgi:release factor glutamine methyltransferase